MRDVVNEDDQVVGRASKEQIAAQGLNCRVAFIMLANKNGELLLHQRAATKKAYPLFWSGAAAGHLISGETYEQGAHRELREELGIDAALRFLGSSSRRPTGKWSVCSLASMKDRFASSRPRLRGWNISARTA